MPTESSNGFTTRHRLAIALGATLAAVLLLVLVYRLTTPKTAQTTSASGAQISEKDVLQVGALPVT